MLDVRILSLMLAFIRHMDQIIEARTVQVAFNERLELFLVKTDQISYGLAKRIQQLPSVLTVHQASHGALDTHRRAPPPTRVAIGMP